MKNVPIKFRGSAKGSFVFGEYHRYCGKYLDTVSIVLDNGCLVPVDPDSVVQLVGYDADGKEVYEGDILVTASGCEFRASLEGVVTRTVNDSYRRYLNDSGNLRLYKLKSKNR